MENSTCQICKKEFAKNETWNVLQIYGLEFNYCNTRHCIEGMIELNKAVNDYMFDRLLEKAESYRQSLINESKK